MIILGLDPGFGRTGYGIINVTDKNHSSIDYGVIETNPKIPFEERLLELSQDINTLIKQYKPDECSIEELFFGQNVKTGMKVAEARGVVLHEITKSKIPIRTYTPLQIKSAVSGYGKADKSQVQKMVTEILDLPGIPTPDDAADALAIAACHTFSLQNSAINI